MTRRLAKIAVAKIDATDTIREADHAWVQALAEQMKAEGQLQPIEVAVDGDRYALVFGLHRKLAADLLRWKTIDALVDDAGGDAETLRRRAIHENLFRRELSYLDRAVHVGELHASRKAEVGERRGGDRRSEAAADQKPDGRVFGLSEEIAEQVGLSSTVVDELLFVLRRLDAAVRHRITSKASLTHLANRRACLLALARCAEDDAERKTRQLEILSVIEAGDAGMTVAEAIAGKPSKPGQKEWLKRSLDGFDRLKPEGQFQFLSEREAVVKAFARKKGWF